MLAQPGLGPGVILRGQTFDLLDVEDCVTLQEGDFALKLIAGVCEGALNRSTTQGKDDRTMGQRRDPTTSSSRALVKMQQYKCSSTNVLR